MKGIDIFCASQASTAICMSMEQLASSSSSSSSSTIELGGRAIDRHNPIIRDPRRIPRRLPSAPCSYEPPINPIPYHQLQKSTKKGSSKNKPNDKTKKSTILSSKENDQKKKNSSTNPIVNNQKNSCISSEIKNSCVKTADLITPPGSTRYLLSDSVLFDGLLDYGGPVKQLLPFGDKKNQTIFKENEIHAVNEPADFLSHSKPSPNQVVVLRVSLHCKGCVGKVKKHLSRMEGVTSFNIDFAAKKVTIIGDVTPEGVLESVSKVRKNAQFWPINSSVPGDDTNATNIGIKIS